MVRLVSGSLILQLYGGILHCTALTVQQRADQVVLTPPHTDQGDTHQPSYYTDICEIWYTKIDNHITQLRYFITRYFTVDVSKLNVFFTSFIDRYYTLKISCYIKVLYLVTDLPTHSQIATIWRLDQSPWLQWLAGALNIVWVTAVKTPAQDKKFPIVAGLLLAAAGEGLEIFPDRHRPGHLALYCVL